MREAAPASASNRDEQPAPTRCCLSSVGEADSRVSLYGRRNGAGLYELDPGSAKGGRSVGRVEEVVGLVRHERLLADVCCRGTVRRCEPSGGVQPLDEGSVRQRVATGRSILGPNPRNLEPGDGTVRDEVGGGGVGGGVALVHLAPDGARVRVLPRDANRASGLTPDRREVRAGEVSDDLPTMLVEQRGLGREEHVGEASA